MSYFIASLIGLCIISGATICALKIKPKEFFGNKTFDDKESAGNYPLCAGLRLT